MKMNYARNNEWTSTDTAHTLIRITPTLANLINKIIETYTCSPWEFNYGFYFVVWNSKILDISKFSPEQSG